MKVDRSKLKKSSSEVPADCKVLIDKLKGLSPDDLYKELKDIKSWTYGKCELYHWADILDIFDAFLEKSCNKENEKKWTLHCDLGGSEQLKKLLLEILRFTALLIEHSFSRHLYNSMDHLTTLLTSCDMSTVLYVLNLLYVFSKRSNFISRMNPEKRQGLIQRLIHLAESWGGKENGFGLAECCQDLPSGSFPLSATTLHFEFYTESKEDKDKHFKKFPSGTATIIQSIHMENVDKTGRMPSQIMEDILDLYDVPLEKQVLLFTHIRLACLFSNYEARVHCVQARLQAISILVYSSAIQDNMNVILYPGLIEELVDIVEIKDSALVDIKSAALRTLTSVIHIERNPRLNSIIDATGASSYHGFLPVLVRTCIQHMIDPELKPFTQTYATSLFSFLYHLASYDNGVEALVSCGMMESLLKVINWYGDGQEHITFVTRAVRVIDLITNMDMAAFQAHGGLQAFINRLEHEVNICRIEQPFVIKHRRRETSMDAMADSPSSVPMDTSLTEDGESIVQNSETPIANTSSSVGVDSTLQQSATVSINKSVEEGSTNCPKGRHCFAQRAALLKSMLNFMKKAIPDLSFAESIRHLMDGSLPKSLKHIISNAEYYGPSLFLLATDVVTVYVFQEPSLLSSLQDKGLTDVVLHALLIKDVPATREVLAALPNVFSALCLNARGLEAFVACKPFDRLFKVLLSPDYLPAMRRRRSSDTFGDTASNLGNAMDELMRHQPSLRTDATKAIIKLLEEICSMGQDPHFICQKQQPKSDQTAAQSSVRSPQSNEASSSDEEEDEEVEMSSTVPPTSHVISTQEKQTVPSTSQQDPMQSQERQAIPLMDYVLNVMKFVEAILSNNSTDDHCKEFVAQNGLKPLMSILGLPNLPIDFPSSPACQAVSSACKSVLTLSRESKVIKQGLLQMHEVLQRLEPLHNPLEPPGGSVLLHELANCAHIPDATLSPTATPLLHALAAAHAYIMMFVHVCRMGQIRLNLQTDIRTISVDNWGSDLGLEVLKGLSSLYNSLVWESTVLLALCNEDYLPADCSFGRADLEKLLSKDTHGETVEAESGKEGKSSESKTDKKEQSGLSRGVGDMGSNGVSVAMETLTTGEERMDTSELSPLAQNQSDRLPEAAQAVTVEAPPNLNPLATVVTSTSSTSIESDILPGPIGLGTGSDDKDAKKKLSPAMQAQLRQLKPLLTLSSRLGRALSELFVLLVKLCVGSPVRQRRSQQPPPTPPIPSPAARAVALALTKLLAGGLSFQPPPCAPQPKLRMTFLVCSAGFTAPMLFDEKKQPYHLMLQKFVACGGQAALFQSFSWALSIDGKVPLSEGLEHADLPEGTGEFLDSWLTLVEKMINPKAVLDSPHTLPSKDKAPGLTPFNPVQYLISTQKAAFNSVMNLWNKKPLLIHGSRMSESILTILCHIIDGEAKIKKFLEKEKLTPSGSGGDSAVDLSGAGTSGVSNGAAAAAATLASTTARRPLETMINQAHLQQLMDMGFTREQATVALNNTTSLEQATDYILTNTIPATSQNPLAGAMDLELNDEVQMMRAIAMSLGENAVMSTDQTKPENKEDKSEEAAEKQEAEEPLDTTVLDEFTFNIFPGCLNLLDTLPETVYRVCDLLIVVMIRNGADWKRQTLGTLCKDLCELCEEMTSYAKDLNFKAMQGSSSAQKFATRLHLLSLLAEYSINESKQEMNLACALAMQRVNLPNQIVHLLQISRDAMLCPGQVADAKQTPKWLAPMLLLLDLWEKISVALKRKMQARIAVGGNRIWKWFDDSSGRWCKYSSNNNATIDEAYKKGDSFVRFQAGRRKYTVQFGTMIQLNEETGNRRPVMLSIPTAEEKPPGKKEIKDNPSEEDVVALKCLFSEDIKKEFEVPSDIDDYLPGLTPDSIETVISCLSAYLSIPLNSDTLHAAMRLILRMTRQHHNAVKFVAEGGAKRLLTLTLDSNFQGFLNLATLIFRHILEEPVSLRYCMEKVMRNVCAGIGSCQSGVSQGGVGAKEMHYVLRVLGPAACRDHEMFSQVARDTLQIALPPPSLRDEDETRYWGPNAPQILKCTPTKQLESLVNTSIKTFIWDLLNALIAEQPNKNAKDNTASQTKGPQTLAEVLQEASEGQSGGSAHFPWVIHCGTGSNVQQMGENETGEKDSSPSGADESSTPSFRPLIPKSAILRLLSEIIRSYGNCVQLITQYNYQPGQTELVSEGCSVLAFVLDSLLPCSQEVGDKDCPALSRVFIASIASCSHSPDAQMALVAEVKGALQRALVLPESSSKHQRIQALASIINTMIESCPTPGQVPNQVFKGQQVMNNNMMKILVKKGVLVDLARIPHSLDLSSPFLAPTINAVLKPLETLSRSVNSPDKFVSMKKSSADHNTTAPDQGGTTTQVVTEPALSNVEMPAAPSTNEMNITIEDVTNNPDAQIDLETSSDHQIAEPQVVGQEEELDTVLQQIFQSEPGGDPEDQVISEMTISNDPAGGEEDNEILIDVEVEGDEDDYEGHDSQMVSQVLSDEDDEGDVRDHRDRDDNQDDVSGDEEDYDEADQEEIGEEDDEDDEEDDEEDDDDASDIDGEGDDYQEMRNPFDTDDLVFHMEGFPSGGGGQHIIFNDASQIQTYQLPVHLHDNDNGTDTLPSMPPAPSNITSTHPLLMRQGDPHSIRGHRGSRQRLRALPTVHVNLNSTTRQPNTPVILQRLLGPASAAEILQLTSTLSNAQSAGGSGPTRVVLAGDNFPVIQRGPDDDLFEELFQDPYSDGGSSGTGALSCIPSTLTRWTEETKVLDGDGVHDLVMILKPPLIEELVKRRDEELAERKEKRKKTAEASGLTDDKKKDELKNLASSSSAGSINAIPCNGSVSNTENSASQAAEMLASAMVEQVFSPMVTSSMSGLSQPAATAATTAAGSANAMFTSIDLPSLSPSAEHRQTTESSSVQPSPRQFQPEIPNPGGLTSFSSQSQLIPSVISTQASSVSTALPQFADMSASIGTSSFSSVMPGLFHPLPSLVASAGNPQLIDTPSLEGWAVGIAPPRDETRPTANPIQGSMISQLLDSIMADQPYTSSNSSTTTTPSFSSSLAQGLPFHTSPRPPMHVRHIPWPPDGHFTVPPPHFFLSSAHDPTIQATTTAASTNPQQRFTSGLSTSPMSFSQSVASNSNRQSPALNEASLMGENRALPSTNPASSLCGSLDLTQDLSSILSPQSTQPGYSSGVTGATPPLSNLTFVTTTAPFIVSTTAPTVSGGIGEVSLVSSGANSTSTAQQGGSSTDPELPEGVDPSFLAALPEHIRQEVISEQLRLQRIRRRAQEQAQQSVSANESGGNESSTAMEVNPEFLAALPPAIQEEVLAQQRAEQARMAALQQNAANPDLPVDPATFFSTLSTSLRQQVLSDMDDSMLAVLPPELAAEAQELRRDMEERHRRLLQERLFAQAGAASISAILRHSGLAGRLGTRYAIRAAPRHNQWSFGGSRLNPAPTGTSNPTKVKGRFMLDAEALTCLLVLLFIDEPKLNTTRLHRVLRNLCYHGPTRAWLIRALLSIVQKAGDSNTHLTSNLCVEGNTKDKGKGKKSALSSLTSSPAMSLSSFDTQVSMQSESASAPNLSHPLGIGATTPVGSGAGGYWLSISLEAALGCRANVFQIHRTSGKKLSSSAPAHVSIHPQAAPVVCRHALDTLISLAKVFPTYFLPAGKVKEVNKCEAGEESELGSCKKSTSVGQPAASQSSPKSAKPAETPSRHEIKQDNDFWSILVRLDSTSGKSKGKGVQRSHSGVTSESEMLVTDYAASALGQLMSMLNHPVVRRSQLLTDRLLRLLGLISVSLPDSSRQSTTATTTTTTSVARASTAVTVTSATTAPTLTTAPVTSAGPTPVTTQEPVPAASPGLSTSGQESKKKDELLTIETELEEDEAPILYNQLKLAVEVLTSKSCSEEGLEDATNLLLQLSWANTATRAAVLELLLSGARQLGMTVCSHINSLLEQLRDLNLKLGIDLMDDENSSDTTAGSGSSGASQPGKGILQDRFSSGASIVVSAPARLKTGRELQLPSMSQLTSKTSGQQFFLRILKVIIQLRDAARTAGNKHKKPVGRGRGRSGFEQIHAILNSVVNDDDFLNLFGDNQMLPEPPNVVAQLAGRTASTTTNRSSIPDGPTVSQSQASQGQEEISRAAEVPMEVDSLATATGGAATDSDGKVSETVSSMTQVSGSTTLPRLSEQLGLEELWNTLGYCLAELARTPDHHAVLILQPAVEAFFIVHAGEKSSKPSEQPLARREDQLAHLNMEMAPPSPSPGPSSAEGPLSLLARDNSGIAMASITHLPPDTQKFLKFAETHRTVLNQILRQSTLPLAEGPFSVLVDYTRILDFDVKRRYFRQELERMNEGARREDLPVHVRRSNVFEDSFRELFRRTPEEWKQRFYIVFEGEEGQDAGGLLREWYIIISHEIFNQNYALFLTSPGDRVTYSINPSSHCNSNHLSYFKFVGRIIAKAVYDNKLLDCYFTRSFYKHMLGLAVKYTDMESEDYSFYQGLVFLLENNVTDLGYDIFFSTEIQEFGVTETRELIPNGSNVLVTDENKREYVKLVCQMKMTGAIRQQLNAFLEGFYDIIPKKLVSIFTEQELELLISGLPTIDIDDLKANTEYHKYQATSLQIQWFWRALRSFDQAERANFLQFVTGTSKVPLGGFGNLEGMNGTQKFQIHRDDRSTDRLPSAHTCFNQLDLPAYETYDKLRKMLLLAISECSEGFGLA
ncbi:E3 ubiquitin-protein ligase HUWE1-like isoform X5 [Physella acuta]|uniref:E3 ubiquitin-protein ligase HUWE1-like isoform X5 n=1 Tax=Physella acuta TaxID=109671 RepID=UPI0027DE46C3|nr:E3 ubiquitin-protein ligase HUWE1-like isoform X5 [Physella acuta]